MKTLEVISPKFRLSDNIEEVMDVLVEQASKIPFIEQISKIDVNFTNEAIPFSFAIGKGLTEDQAKLYVFYQH